MSLYYFSFGQNHVHRYENNITLDADSIVEIEADDEGVAREVMFEAFGPAWGFSYTEDRIDMSYFPRGVVLRLDQHGQKR